MQYRSLFKFYFFGTCLRYLQDASPHYEVHSPGGIIVNINELFSTLEELKMSVTARLAHQKLDDFVARLQEIDERYISKELADQLQETMTNLRETLESEIEGVGAYTPTPKRLDLDRLLNDVSTLFSPNVFVALPTIAQFDFGEAGKCIAFERPTAAAFHILRGTEDVLRFYYLNMVRHGRIGNLMWGPIVEDLARHKATKKAAALNNHLDNIRRSFRNPTQHPEATYDIHEAQDLWAVCVDVVNRMVKILATEKRLPGAKPVPKHPDTP